VDIKVLYEDSDLVVLDKPSSVVVNRAQSVKGETVQDFIEDKILNLKSQAPNSKQISSTKFQASNSNGAIGQWSNRSGIVHRLDKETSGVLIVAKNPRAFEDLQKQFKERKVKKEYIALVHGKITSRKGTIDVPVGRTPWDREKFGVLPDGKASLTEYRIEKYFEFEGDEYTQVKLKPLTGRTHQIRVHLRYLGYPIVSDSKYVGRKRFKKDIKWCPRLFLHASSIEFEQPRNKQIIKVESKLSKKLLETVKELKMQKSKVKTTTQN
jgi:23S rRNA pseudouridine1911/1915/1917 synthase